jgi:hypothetical protein
MNYSNDESSNLSPGDLVYYDRYGGKWQTVFPFDDPNAQGLGIIVSEIMSYETDNGQMVEYLLDYLRPAEE